MEDRKRTRPGNEEEVAVQAAPPKQQQQGECVSSGEESEGDRKVAALSTAAVVVDGEKSSSGDSYPKQEQRATVSTPSDPSDPSDDVADGPTAAAAAAAGGGGSSNGEDEDDEDRAKKRMRTDAAATSQSKVSHEDRWIEMFNRLLVYKEKHGSCRVPNRYPEDSQLGFWVSAQRRQFKIASTSNDGSSALTPERAKKLEVIGFEWSTTNPHHTPWETRYGELGEFVQKYGHAEVPMRWKENPKLSHWVSKQRHDFKLRKQGKSSRLNNKKLKLLNDLGFLWEGSRRSLKEKISLGGSDDSVATGEESALEPPAASGSDALSQANLNAAAAIQAAYAAASNPGLVPVQGNPAAAAAAAAVQAAQQGLPPENFAQMLQAIASAQQAQPIPAAVPSFLNLAAASASQPQMNVDPNNVNAVLSLVGQLLGPLISQPAQPQVQVQLPFQQLLLQSLAPQQQPLQVLQLPQQAQLQQVTNMAAAGNQQAIVNAIQQAMAVGQAIPFMIGNQQPIPAAAPVGNDSIMNHLRILQMAGLSPAPAVGAAPLGDGATAPGNQGQGPPRPQDPPNPPGNNCYTS